MQQPLPNLTPPDEGDVRLYIGNDWPQSTVRVLYSVSFGYMVSFMPSETEPRPALWPVFPYELADIPTTRPSTPSNRHWNSPNGVPRRAYSR